MKLSYDPYRSEKCVISPIRGKPIKVSKKTKSEIGSKIAKKLTIKLKVSNNIFESEINKRSKHGRTVNTGPKTAPKLFKLYPNKNAVISNTAPIPLLNETRSLTPVRIT